MFADNPKLFYHIYGKCDSVLLQNDLGLTFNIKSSSAMWLRSTPIHANYNIDSSLMKNSSLICDLGVI